MRELKLSLKSTKLFWSKVHKGEACWTWLGFVDNKGYGEFSKRRAHRLALALSGIEVPSDKDVHHKCENPLCVRLDHLEVTGFHHRGYPKSQRTHCIAGHEFTPENTLSYNGHRICRTCNRINSQARYDALRVNR